LAAEVHARDAEGAHNVVHAIVLGVGGNMASRDTLADAVFTRFGERMRVQITEPF